MAESDPDRALVERYRELVARLRPDKVAAWPVLSGYNVKYATCRGWTIIILIATGVKAMISTNGVGELPADLLGSAGTLDWSTVDSVRERVERHFRLTLADAVLFADQTRYVPGSEFEQMFHRHEAAMGLGPMRVFLSHKGADKPLVRDFKDTLTLLGFEPWLDEDAMPAGTDLERGLLKGFHDSCAAVFFITPNFADEKYLATEVDYAVQEKRSKGDRFQIITLVLGGADQSHVPDLLRKYVWKTPSSHLEAAREILKALPLKVGPVRWK